MSTEIVIEDKRSASLVPAEPDSSILAVMERLASNPNLDADKIEKLFNVFINGQRKMREMMDEQEFAHRMAEFKENPPEIIKNRKAQMKSKDGSTSWVVPFADLDAYCKEAMPEMAKRGITWSFPFSENGNLITVSCILRYGLYNHTPTTLTAAPDTSGAKNDLQAKGSTVAYLERYTFCGATGLTAAMPDTDGNLNGISPEDREARLKAIRTAPDLEALKKVYFAASKAATETKDTEALRLFTEAKETRKKELAHA
jgi:hypothetical protein